MSLDLRSKLYVGKVRHRRMQPKPHAFTYSVAYLWLDLDEVTRVFSMSPLWSVEKCNLVAFFRKDFLQTQTAENDELKNDVIELIYRQTGRRFEGSVFMLAHLRYLGHSFNPVVFYYCYQGGELQYIVSEINNTPWDEKHAYVLAVDEKAKKTGGSSSDDKQLAQFEFEKDFHVSPFMPMDLMYDWRFFEKGKERKVHMNLNQGDERVFDATLSLEATPLTAMRMNLFPLQFGFMTVKTVTAIYIQAFKLWLKRVPFFTHPDKLVSESRN